METIYTLLLVLQVIVSITLIGFVLIQHGKGADAGAAFGSGASATVFGSRGSGNFFTKVTTALAIIFLANSLFLGYLSSHSDREQGSLLTEEPVTINNTTENRSVDKGDSVPVSDVPAVNEATESPVSDIPELPGQ